MKNSYLTAGITLGRFIGLLKRNKVDITARTISRLAFLFQSACWSSIFSVVEKARSGKVLKNATMPEDPIFIIGHWRTGSTFLHQLFSLDPNLHTPTLFEVAVPDSFLVSYPYYRPIFKRLVSEHRPMDSVKIGMDEPQEDEYAFYRTSPGSPLESLVFQKSGDYFLKEIVRPLPKTVIDDGWKKSVATFFTKLHHRHNLRIVSKNPFNSFRIKILSEIFPKARFIHIIRHPYEVVPSTIHMWKILRDQNRLTRYKKVPTVEEVSMVLDQLLAAVNKAKSELPSGTLIEIRFEELEKDPRGTLENLYQQLSIPFTEVLQKNILDFLTEIGHYQKNDFKLTGEEKQLIYNHLKTHMQNYSYR